ncbi:MAG: hypothetical protein Kow0069_14650 [Promethearchaeota archaeon]
MTSQSNWVQLLRSANSRPAGEATGVTNSDTGPGTVVVCGLGTVGAATCAAFLARNWRVLAIDANGGAPGLIEAARGGATPLVGDGKDEGFLRRLRLRPDLFFATTGDDATNVGVVATAFRAFPGTFRAFVRLDRSVAASRELFRRRFSGKVAAPSGGVSVEIFDPNGVAARLLFLKHPVDDYADTRTPDAPPVHLVFAGFGPLGRALLLQAARVCHFLNGKRVACTVVDPRAKVLEKKFEADFPGVLSDVFDPRSKFLAVEFNGPEFLSGSAWDLEGTPASAFFACAGGDELNADLARKLLTATPGVDSPVFVHQRAGGGRPFSSPRVIPFGYIDEVCSAELVVDDVLSVLAARIHEHYREHRLRGSSPEQRERMAKEPKMQPWETLDDDLKSLNRHQADHVPVKLRAVGAWARAAGPDGPADFQFTEREVKALARVEHARWVAVTRLRGYRLDRSLDTTDHVRRLSPYLVPWEELSEEIKGYDAEPVLQIPPLLASVGLEVFRQGVETGDAPPEWTGPASLDL